MYLKIYRCKINPKIWILDVGCDLLPEKMFLKNFYFWNFYRIKNKMWYHEIVFRFSLDSILLESINEKYKFITRGDEELSENILKDVLGDVIWYSR
jgi:hypothetical protein